MFARRDIFAAVAGEAPKSQPRAYDRSLLLGDKRNAVLDLAEVQRYGRDTFGDADYLSIYGLKPADWYAKGVRLLGRTTVECTRDRFADLIGRDVAAAVGSASGVNGSVVVDPFAGSGNTLYWITRRVRPARSVGFELDDVVFALTRENLSITDLGIDVLHQGYEPGLQALSVPNDALVIVFVSPPWGAALDDATGLDVRRTTPPVAEIVDLATTVFHQNKLLFAIQAYELVEAESLADLTRRFDWSAFNVYDINPHAKNPGLVLGSVGWTV
jgi:predicted RNA methylase